MRHRHRNVRVHQTHGAVELEKRQQKHRWRRHAVGQQPEKHMLVTQEAVARKRIRGRQGHGDRNNRVDGHINQAVDIARVPRHIGKDGGVVVPSGVHRKQAEAGQNFLVGAKAHIDHPINGQQSKHDVEQQEQMAFFEAALIHGCSPWLGCPRFASSCRG